jgi:hypothetical protein
MKRRYINDPHWRTVFERADAMSWWESTICVLFFVFVMLPVVLVMRLFGWRPNDD